MAIAKEQLRQIIADNDINRVGDIYTLFKDSFKDMLQELLEAEMDSSIGYTKHNKQEIDSKNKRNGYSQRLSKVSMVNFRSIFPVTGLESMSQKSFQNTSGIFLE